MTIPRDPTRLYLEGKLGIASNINHHLEEIQDHYQKKIDCNSQDNGRYWSEYRLVNRSDTGVDPTFDLKIGMNGSVQLQRISFHDVIGEDQFCFFDFRLKYVMVARGCM